MQKHKKLKQRKDNPWGNEKIEFSLCPIVLFFFVFVNPFASASKAKRMKIAQKLTLIKLNDEFSRWSRYGVVEMSMADNESL